MFYQQLVLRVSNHVLKKQQQQRRRETRRCPSWYAQASVVYRQEEGKEKGVSEHCNLNANSLFCCFYSFYWYYTLSLWQNGINKTLHLYPFNTCVIIQPSVPVFNNDCAFLASTPRWSAPNLTIHPLPPRSHNPGESWHRRSESRRPLQQRRHRRERLLRAGSRKQWVWSGAKIRHCCKPLANL